MAVRFVAVDRNAPQMFSPDVEGYLPPGYLARFIVEALHLSRMAFAYSGRGSAAYHPSMMVALLFYEYATGTFSSRKLERATYDSIAVRYICCNVNADHAGIRDYRKRFLSMLSELFQQILPTDRGC